MTPATIKIGPIDYEVKRIEGLHDHDSEQKRVQLNGHILSDRCEIRVEETLPEQRIRITVWHEVLHGILFGAAVETHDEQLITALAYGLVQVIRDNPDLIRYTVEEVNHGD